MVATPCGFESHHRHHVGASCISLAPTFFKSQSSLIPLLLLSDRDSLRWIRGRFLAGGETKIFGMKLPDSSSQASYRLRRVFYASHQKLIPRSFCCSSLPNRTRCAGLRFGLGNENIRNEAACTRYRVQAAFLHFSLACHVRSHSRFPLPLPASDRQG